MTHCPFCNKRIQFSFFDYLGLCDNHNMNIRFYARFNLIEFEVGDYTLCRYPNKLSLIYQHDQISSIQGSFDVSPDSVNSIIEKMIKYNAFI